MWNLSLPSWEFVVRALIVYGVLLVLLRITGKRRVGQIAPFDLILMLVLSNMHVKRGYLVKAGFPKLRASGAIPDSPN